MGWLLWLDMKSPYRGSCIQRIVPAMWEGLGTLGVGTYLEKQIFGCWQRFLGTACSALNPTQSDLSPSLLTTDTSLALVMSIITSVIIGQGSMQTRSKKMEVCSSQNSRSITDSGMSRSNVSYVIWTLSLLISNTALSYGAPPSLGFSLIRRTANCFGAMSLWLTW